MNTTRIMTAGKMLCFATLGFLAASPAFAELELIQSPVRESAISRLHFFSDRGDNPNLAYQRANLTAPDDFFHLIADSNSWSSPISILPPAVNQRDLHAVTTLSNGMPLLIMSGDNSNYVAMFNLPGPIVIPEDEEAQIIPGVSNAELENILADNQRLFFSLQTVAGWTAPLPINGTQRAQNAVAAAGPAGNALVVFGYDQDKNDQTKHDNELYITAYNNHVWSTPVRLTNNSQFEYGVKIRYVGSRYVVVWSSDQDSDIETQNDQAIYYTSFSTQGSVQTAASLVSNNVLPGTTVALGQHQNEAVLLWVSKTAPAGSIIHPVMESRLNSSWSTPVATTLLAGQMNNAEVYSVADHLLLIYSDKNTLQAGHHDGNGWSMAGAVTDLAATGLRIREIRHTLDASNSLTVAVAGYVPEVDDPNDDDDSEVSGLYIGRYSLLPDLRIGSAVDSPALKRLGANAKLTFTVANTGFLRAPAYQVELQRDGQLLATLNGSPLPPGQQQVFEQTIALQNANTPVNLIINTTFPEADSGNNQHTHLISVLPDFEIRSVERASATQLIADIRELKGVAAPLATVDFYNIENGRRTKIGTGEFDSNIGLPVTLEWPEMAAKIDAFKVEAEINAERLIKEDEYDNNNNAFLYAPMPDLVVSRLHITDDEILITARNQGTVTVQQARLILTNDPAVAADAEGSLTPAYNTVVSLGGTQQVELDIPVSTLTLETGDTLYAVINPYGEVAESDRNNNSRQHVVLTEDAQSGGQGGDAAAELTFGAITAWCGNLNVDIHNDGTAAAVTPTVRLLNSQQQIIAQNVLATIAPEANESVGLHDLAAGVYQLQLSYDPALSEPAVTETLQVTLTSSANCTDPNINDRNIGITDLQQVSGAAGLVSIRVDFSLTAQALNYRRPLLRLPVTVEVMQGLRIDYRADEVIYIAGHAVGGVYSHTFTIPVEVFQSGQSTVRVRLPVRDDDAVAADDVRTLTVNF